MHEIFDKIIEFIWGVWRYRWGALITAWAIALVGWFMIAQIDARYPASARLFVDTNRILEPLLTGIAVQPNAQQRVAMMSKTVLSRTNLNMLIEKHKLDETEEGEILNRNDLIDQLTTDIVITDVNNRKSIYQLTYSDKDPDTAKAVLESLIEVFIATSFDEERNDNASAQVFIDKQIADYDGRLTAAEERLAEFKREHAGSLPGEQGGYYQRMESLVALQRASQLELQETTNEVNTLRRNLAAEERKIVSGAGTDSPYDARIAELQSQLDDLLVRFTDKHPQVSILNQSLADLRRKKQAEVGGGSSKSAALLQSSVVYQQLSTLLAEAEAAQSKLRVRDASYQSRLSELRGTIDSIPEVEAQFTQLDRDYETIRAQHATLLNKREAARITSNIDTDSSDVTIRSLDRPFVPSRPTDPDRLLLNILTLIAAIGLGVMLAFFMSVLHPVFYNQRSLEHLMNIPVLGSVSFARKAGDRVAAILKNLRFWLLTVLLPIFCIIVVILQLSDHGIYQSLKLGA